VNCTPFVRQYDILNNKWGVFMPRGKPNRKYSGEFKQTVVETMVKEQLGYQETAERFGILKQRVFDWERIYLAEGAEGLYKERRGRNGCGRSKTFPTKVEEDLLAEVQRLRAENAYLKNLQALVLEDERRQHKKRW